MVLVSVRGSLGSAKCEVPLDPTECEGPSWSVLPPLC